MFYGLQVNTSLVTINAMSQENKYKNIRTIDGMKILAHKPTVADQDALWPQRERIDS